MFFVKYLLNIFDSIAMWGLVALMAFMSIVTFLAVIFRFILHSPLTWSEEAARYMMVWVTYLGAGIAVKKGRHIGVTMFISKVPLSLRKSLIIFSEIIVIVFLFLLVYQGINLLLTLKDQISPAMGLPMVIPYFAIPFGCFYMFLHLLEMLLSRSIGLLSTSNVELKKLEEERGK
ncbi:MAG: TRAP transporter small permease [Synergistetes bacterium]|nr:TRAP transporter small permease [Synergistota bacterium]MCX8127742.1 TRAP transporter small permease [Synergistota bacterium]MDW8191343.1 TRAP transporter small permease [Synergistota bacterium]